MPSHLHLLTRSPDAAALRTMRAQRAAGTEVRCLLIQDAVFASGEALASECDVLLQAQTDRTRRGLPELPGALTPAEIVAAIVDSDSVTAW